jgi:hypothetical protein
MVDQARRQVHLGRCGRLLDDRQLDRRLERCVLVDDRQLTGGIGVDLGGRLVRDQRQSNRRLRLDGNRSGLDLLLDGRGGR